MCNIYRSRSKLSSLATRWLVESYAKGLSASETRRVMQGDVSPNSAGLIRRAIDDDFSIVQPAGQSSQVLIDQFLGCHPSSIQQIQRFIRYRMDATGEAARPICISRQTINEHYLFFGQFVWWTLARTYLNQRVGPLVEALEEINHDLGLEAKEAQEVCERLMLRHVQRQTRIANSCISLQSIDHHASGQVIDFLTERAKRLNGLSISRAAEHYSWAFLINSVARTKKRDDRNFAARYLAQELLAATRHSAKREPYGGAKLPPQPE